jgi:hypothetical protein
MRLTKAYMLDYERVARKAGLLDLYMFDVQNGREPDATKVYPERKASTPWGDADCVRGQLFRAGSASGGYVVLFYVPREKGQSGDAEIAYLDDINAQMRDEHSEHTLTIRIVLERLTVARDKLACAVDELR